MKRLANKKLVGDNMKKKLTLAMCIGGLALALVGAGCANLNELEKNQQEGYKIMVRYDANGGSFLNRPGITIVDQFNPSRYTADGANEVHVKLKEPTDPSRPTSGSEAITLTLQNHFFAGWYQNREIKMVNGVPVDANGEALTQLDDGTYVYTSTINEETPKKAIPAYDYSGYWDFENDTVDYNVLSEEPLEITLYAGWVPYYEFEYYFQENNQWVKSDVVTTFDYKTTNTYQEESDQDTIYLPSWKDGAMNYKTSYLNKAEYTFPKMEGTTFEKAYLDEACTQEISVSLEHHGTLDVAYGAEKALKVENHIQKIYVTVAEGENYRIETAEQLVKNANAKGNYELAGDMDFTNLSWPAQFSSGTFTGSFYGKNGQKVTLSNIVAKYASTSSKVGGLFGKIAVGATFENVAFTNVTVDFSSIGNRNNDAEFGLFAGVIEEGATLTNVSIDGKIRIGEIGKADGLSFHKVANGTWNGLTVGEIKVFFYGTLALDGKYYYTINVNTAEVSESGEISFAFYPSRGKMDNESYEINKQNEN